MLRGDKVIGEYFNSLANLPYNNDTKENIIKNLIATDISTKGFILGTNSLKQNIFTQEGIKGIVEFLLHKKVPNEIKNKLLIEKITKKYSDKLFLSVSNIQLNDPNKLLLHFVGNNFNFIQDLNAGEICIIDERNNVLVDVTEIVFICSVFDKIVKFLGYYFDKPVKQAISNNDYLLLKKILDHVFSLKSKDKILKGIKIVKHIRGLRRENYNKEFDDFKDNFDEYYSYIKKISPGKFNYNVNDLEFGLGSNVNLVSDNDDPDDILVENDLQNNDPQNNNPQNNNLQNNNLQNNNLQNNNPQNNNLQNNDPQDNNPQNNNLQNNDSQNNNLQINVPQDGNIQDNNLQNNKKKKKKNIRDFLSNNKKNNDLKVNLENINEKEGMDDLEFDKLIEGYIDDDLKKKKKNEGVINEEVINKEFIKKEVVNDFELDKTKENINELELNNDKRKKCIKRIKEVFDDHNSLIYKTYERFIDENIIRGVSKDGSLKINSLNFLTFIGIDPLRYSAQERSELRGDYLEKINFIVNSGKKITDYNYKKIDNLYRDNKKPDNLTKNDVEDDKVFENIIENVKTDISSKLKKRRDVDDNNENDLKVNENNNKKSNNVNVKKTNVVVDNENNENNNKKSNNANVKKKNVVVDNENDLNNSYNKTSFDENVRRAQEFNERELNNLKEKYIKKNTGEMVKDTNIIKNMELENKDDKKILPTLKSKDVTLKIVKKNNFDSVNYNVSLSFRNIFKVEPQKNDVMVFYDKFTFNFLEKVSKFFDFSFFDENKVARIKEESFVNLDTTFYNFLLDENLDLSFENDVHNNFCLYLLCLQFLFLFFKKNRFYDSSIKVANSLFNRNNENRLLKFLSKTFSSKDNLNKITVDESADKIFNENFKDLYKSKLYNTIYSRLKEIKIKGISNVNESYFGSKEKAFNKLFLKKNDYTLRNINYEQFDSYYSLLADYDKNAYLEYSNLNPSKQINFYKGNEKKGNEKIIENVNSFLKTRKEEFELIEKIKGLDEILEYLRVNNVLLSNVEKSIENIAKKLEENNLPSFKQKYANDLKLPKFTQVNLIFSNDSLVDVPEVFKSLLRSMIFSCYFPTYSLKNEIKVDIDLKFTKEIKSNKVIYLPNTNSIYKKAAYYVLNRQCIANNVISYGLVYDSAFNYSMESYDIKDFFDTTNKYLKSEFESDNNINDNVKLFFTALEEIVNGDKNGINVNYDISQVLKKLSNSLQLKTILNRYEPDNNKCALIASYAFNHKDFSNFKNINDIFTLYEKNKDIFQIFDAKNFKFLKKLKGFSIGNLFKDDYCRNFVIEFHRNFNNKNYVGFDKDNNKNIDYFIPYNIVYNILLNYKVCLVHNVFEMRSDVLQNADSISLSCTCKQKIENVDKNVFNLKNHLTGILTKKRLLENYVFTPKNNSANNSRSLSEIKKALN